MPNMRNETVRNRPLNPVRYFIILHSFTNNIKLHVFLDNIRLQTEYRTMTVFTLFINLMV